MSAFATKLGEGPASGTASFRRRHKAHDAALRMTDTSMVRVHQQAACIADGGGQAAARARGSTCRCNALEQRSSIVAAANALEDLHANANARPTLARECTH